MKRLKQIGALLAIAVLIGIRAWRHDFCVYRHAVCTQGADGLPLLCDYRTSAHLCHDAGCQGSVAPR